MNKDQSINIIPKEILSLCPPFPTMATLILDIILTRIQIDLRLIPCHNKEGCSNRRPGIDSKPRVVLRPTVLLELTPIQHSICYSPT